MIKKNILKTILIATLTITMLTACNKNTATVPETSVTENTTIAETTVAETSGENLISTETTEDTKATETTTATTDTEDTKYPTTTASGYKDNTTEETTSSKIEETTTVKATETENTTTEEPVTEPTQPVIETTTETQTETQTETTTKPQPETETTTQQETTTQAPTEAPTEAPKHEHNYSSTVTKEPTCTETGVRTYTCSCGYSYPEDIPTTGHSFGAYTYNNDATTDADGTETAICSVCGVTDTRTAEGTKLDRPKTDEELLAEITFHPFGTKAEINGSVYWSTGGGANDWVKSQGPWTGATLNVPIGDVEMPIDGIEIWFTDNQAYNDAMQYTGLYHWSDTADVIGWYDEGYVRHGYTYRLNE